MINFRVTENISQALSQMEHNLSNLPNDRIAQILVDSVHQNFDEEGRPDAWESRQDDNPWPILNKTGTLRDSIEYDIEGNDISVFATASYGDYHDQGTSRLPARPFLLIQEEDQEEIMQILDEHMGMI